MNILLKNFNIKKDKHYVSVDAINKYIKNFDFIFYFRDFENIKIIRENYIKIIIENLRFHIYLNKYFF